MTANSKLGDGAGTNFELDDDLVLRMTYERFGTELQFVLAGPNSVSIAEAQALSTCSGCVSGAVAAMPFRHKQGASALELQTAVPHGGGSES